MSAQLLTAQGLAERWAVPVSQVWRLAREGRLPEGAVVRLGKYVRFDPSGVEAFEKQGGTE